MARTGERELVDKTVQWWLAYSAWTAEGGKAYSNAIEHGVVPADGFMFVLRRGEESVS